MKDINLLPPVQYKGLAKWIIYPVVIFIPLLIWSVINYGFIRPLNERRDEQELLASMELESDDISLLDLDYTNIQEGYEDLKVRAMSFEEMEMGTPANWYNILETFVTSLPLDTYIISFVCDNTTILISGTSSDDLTSAYFLRNLKDSKVFTDVAMERITYQTTNNKISFQLRCTLDYGESEEVIP